MDYTNYMDTAYMFCYTGKDIILIGSHICRFQFQLKGILNKKDDWK